MINQGASLLYLYQKMQCYFLVWQGFIRLYQEIVVKRCRYSQTWTKL